MKFFSHFDIFRFFGLTSFIMTILLIWLWEITIFHYFINTFISFFLRYCWRCFKVWFWCLFFTSFLNLFNKLLEWGCLYMNFLQNKLHIKTFCHFLITSLLLFLKNCLFYYWSSINLKILPKYLWCFFIFLFFPLLYKLNNICYYILL